MRTLLKHQTQTNCLNQLTQLDTVKVAQTEGSICQIYKVYYNDIVGIIKAFTENKKPHFGI